MLRRFASWRRKRGRWDAAHWMVGVPGTVGLGILKGEEEEKASGSGGFAKEE